MLCLQDLSLLYNGVILKTINILLMSRKYTVIEASSEAVITYPFAQNSVLIKIQLVDGFKDQVLLLKWELLT